MVEGWLLGPMPPCTPQDSDDGRSADLYKNMTWLVFVKDVVSTKHIHLNTRNAKQFHERRVMKPKADRDLATGEGGWRRSTAKRCCALDGSRRHSFLYSIQRTMT